MRDVKNSNVKEEPAKRVMVGFYVTPEMKASMQRAAERDYRSLSQWLSINLERWMDKEKGPRP